MSRPASGLEQLQANWKEMFQTTLPAAAACKSVAQPKWPVQVDHCFARIILDATVGVDAPWMTKIKSPAYRNMSKQQLEDSIDMGEQILNGEVDLVELDNKSLEVRGKGKKSSGKASEKMDKAALDKRKRELKGEGKEQSGIKRKRSSSPSPKEDDTFSSPTHAENKEQPDFKLERTSSPSPNEDVESLSPPTYSAAKENLEPYIKKIALSSKTDFQTKVLTKLCQVPKGRYSTYGAIAKYLHSSPRAVGNALRNKPFASYVPCHRILASGGGLGGFHGSWGKKGQDGLHDDKKRKLLGEEGVMFDGKGMVVGGPWEVFA